MKSSTSNFFRWNPKFLQLINSKHAEMGNEKIETHDLALLVMNPGEHDRKLEEGTEQNVLSGKIYAHPRSRADKLDYDIALIELQIEVKLTAYVRTVCLPVKQDKILMRANQYGLIAGWGHTKQVNYIICIYLSTSFPGSSYSREKDSIWVWSRGTQIPGTVVANKIIEHLHLF